MSASPGRDSGHHRVVWLHRALLVDVAGLASILFVLLDYLKPPSSSCRRWPRAATRRAISDLAYSGHPAAETALPRLVPGAYLGHPPLYYFPLAFLIMAALSPLLGLAAPSRSAASSACSRCSRTPPCASWVPLARPLLGAGPPSSSCSRRNPIWGRTIASTLTGEFSYTYGIGLALLFLGVTYRAYARGDGPWGPAAVLAVTALAHGYAVLWAGLSATYFLYASRRPARTLCWLASVAGLAFALSAFWLLPLLSAWGWTTPYDDPWITIALKNLLPMFLWPLLGTSLFGLVWMLLLAFRRGGPDHRLMFVLHSAVIGVARAPGSPRPGPAWPDCVRRSTPASR